MKNIKQLCPNDEHFQLYFASHFIKEAKNYSHMEKDAHFSFVSDMSQKKIF